ncbi:MAG: hypothetical protein EBT92_14735 [Planctomycetes bacterium]|nr:hypothetical protein [Planctomycetota bacterium]NBY03277.1 hypothetical protein [Planctomycetota bacterium]
MTNFTLKAGSLVLILSFFTFLAIPGAAKAESEAINFRTHDGVLLSGKFYASAKPKEGASVILLHDFTFRKGGDSSQDGWEKLALDLQAAGQSVLSFDFRGHGKSIGVTPNFWQQLHNTVLPGAKMQVKPTKINFSEFTAGYYPNLVNDIAAAKSFLDIKNDDGEANSSNIIVIGAGEGATLGALWMASEWRRLSCEVVDVTQGGGILNLKAPGPKKIVLKAMPAVDPEGSAQLAAIWLSLSPTIAGKSFSTQIPLWLKDISMPRSRRVQMVFVTGTDDKTRDDFSLKMLKTVKPTYSRDKKEAEPKIKASPNVDQKFTGEFKYKTKSVGTKLLEDANDDIVKNYIVPITKKGDNNLRSFGRKKIEDASFSWFFGPLDSKTGNPTIPVNQLGIPAKFTTDGDKIQPLPLKGMGISN